MTPKNDYLARRITALSPPPPGLVVRNPNDDCVDVVLAIAAVDQWRCATDSVNGCPMEVGSTCQAGHYDYESLLMAVVGGGGFLDLAEDGAGYELAPLVMPGPVNGAKEQPVG